MAMQRLILNKYLPVREIGTGGFATVFLAKDMLVQRLVAIKRIELTELDAQRAQWVREDMARDAQIDAINAFETGTNTISLLNHEGEDELSASLEQRYLANIPGLDEARTASALQDPSIVTLLDCQIAGNVVYLIMEYVEGLTLSQLLETYNDKITLDVITAVTKSIAHALEVAHAHGVLHFDIKPDNVLIDAEGKVKVTDFGLATLEDAQGQGTAIAGTIGYMPPEQMNQQALDARTDEWALASVVYEMLVGQNPFVAPTLAQAKTLIDGAELTLPSRCWDGMPEDVDDVLFKALDPDIEDRYDSVEEFADELLPCLGSAERGYKDLAALVKGEEISDVDDYDEDEDSDEDDTPLSGLAKGARNAAGKAHVALRDRFSDLQKSIVLRAYAALASAFLTAFAAWNIAQLGQIDNPLFWAFSLGAGVLGAIMPSLGMLAAGIMLSASLLSNQVYVLGALLLVATGAWWWFAGRKGNATANAALAFPLAASIGAGPFAPCVAGYCSLTLPRALITTAYGSLVCLCLASMGSMDLMNWQVVTHWQYAGDAMQANVWSLVTNLGTWCLIGSWLLAALALSLCGKPRRRFMAVLGALLAFALLMVGIWFAAAFDADPASMIPQTMCMVQVVLSAAACLFMCAAFPSPARLPFLGNDNEPRGRYADQD